MSTNGWPMVPLGDLLESVSRPEVVKPTERYDLLGAHWYAQGLYVKESKDGSGIRASKLYRVEQGDFVYNRLFAWKGSFAVASSENGGCYVSNEFPCFHMDENKLVPGYLRYYFFRESAWNEALGLSSGGTPTSRNRLKVEKLLGMLLPLPPLSEQRRIVAKIDQLAQRIDEAKQLRVVADQGMAAFRPSFLGSVFRGLAEEHDTPTLGDLASKITDGPHKTPSYVDIGLPFVTVQNMVSGVLDFQHLKYITEHDHEEFSRRCKPERGDVLYSKDGATRGRPCFVDTDREFNIFVSVALIKPIRDRLDGRYLCHLLNSSWILDRMKERSRGDMIPHIVLGEIRQFPVPLPKMSEQRKVAKHLDSVLERTTEAISTRKKASTELDALLPSILDRAFKGKL